MIRIKLMSYLRRETHKRSRATHNGRVGGLIVNPDQDAPVAQDASRDKLVRKGGGGGGPAGRSGHLSIHRRLNTRRGRINQR